MDFLNQFMALVAVGSFIKSFSDYIASLFAGQQGVNFVNTVEQGASYYLVNTMSALPIVKSIADVIKSATVPNFVPVIVGVITIAIAFILLLKLI